MTDPRLQAIYDELPSVPCRGLCFDSCSFIGTYKAERRAMRAGGQEPPDMREAPCPLLDFAGRCSAHALRPIVCRLYGVCEEMPCPHGCKPERLLTTAETRAFMERVDALEPFRPGEQTIPVEMLPLLG